MEIGIEELIAANRRFGGHLRNCASLDYALSRQLDERLGRYTKLAYLWRAILVDHPFSDGNKRTAIYLALRFARHERLRPIEEKLIRHALRIAKNNITAIRVITWRLRNAMEERA